MKSFKKKFADWFLRKTIAWFNFYSEKFIIFPENIINEWDDTEVYDNICNNLDEYLLTH